MNRIALVTDAWHPQINGVVTTLTQTVRHLQSFGYDVKTITPEGLPGLPCPTYPEIRLAMAGKRHLFRELAGFAPYAVHIATEGPLGWAARSICRRHGFPFTTSYHTRFPEYLRLRLPIPLRLSYSWLRRFHNSGERTMIATSTLQQELRAHGITKTVLWSRGVDAELFHPADKSKIQAARPIFIYVGRVAVEKNIEAFLQLDLPGTKYVVGDGPALHELKARYPQVVFTGYKTGKALAELVAAADVFVFPSRTDTFGVVLLEAMAAGIPVAAYPVTGPLETVQNGVNGYLDEDLRTAALKALTIPAQSCRSYAKERSWQRCSRQFLANLAIQDWPFGTCH